MCVVFIVKIRMCSQCTFIGFEQLGHKYLCVYLTVSFIVQAFFYFLSLNLLLMFSV